MTEQISKKDAKSRRVILWVSFACWTFSLVLPALLSEEPKHSLPGLAILLIGWLGVVGVQDSTSFFGMLAWWANPLYLLSISRSALSNKRPHGSLYAAIVLALLSFLVSHYATSEAPSYTNIIGYGPGALFWLIAILTLGFVVSRDVGDLILCYATIGCGITLAVLYALQVTISVVGSNSSEREKLPLYAAKRGTVCSVKAPFNPISDKQLAIELSAEDREHWLKALLHWGVNAVQIKGVEYRTAAKNTPEAQVAPYLTSEPVTEPARYLLRAQGGFPYINKWESGGDYVRLTLVDKKSNAELGSIDYKKEWNEKLGFCPSLTFFPDSREEEAIKWLAPFMALDLEK